MSTAIITREEASQLRRQAMEDRAVELVQRDGGSSLAKVLGMRKDIPQDTTVLRQVAFRAPALRHSMDKRNGQDMVHLQGIASTVDEPYEMYDFFGPYEEIVHRNAFDGTLAMKPDVVFVVNHTGLTMARTISVGDKVPTLELDMGTVDEKYGLQSDAWVNPKRTDVQNLVHAIDDGQVTEMSFRFMILEGRWSPDFMTYTITEIDLDRGDVSAENHGANPHTNIAARQQEWLRMAEAMPAGALLRMGEVVGGNVEVMHRYASRQDPGAQAVRDAVAAGQPATSASGRTVDHWEAMLRASR